MVEKKKEYDFILGFEESCGYLTGNIVRDKDAVLACVLAGKVAKSVNLLERLSELYERYGYYFERPSKF
ncbi:MAG: hypothetical protein ACP5PP_07380 [Fervidobacterium sp.]